MEAGSPASLPDDALREEALTRLRKKRDFGMHALIYLLVNGFLVVKLQISAFIATLGSATIIGAFQVIITNQSQPLPPPSQAWLDLTQQKVFGFQIVVYYLFILALIAWWVMDHTPAGRYIDATGGNNSRPVTVAKPAVRQAPSKPARSYQAAMEPARYR